MMKKSAEEVSKPFFQTFCQSHASNSFKYCCRFGYDFGRLALASAVMAILTPKSGSVF
jgi:hypothetical protein